MPCRRAAGLTSCGLCSATAPSPHLFHLDVFVGGDDSDDHDRFFEMLIHRNLKLSTSAPLMYVCFASFSPKLKSLSFVDEAADCLSATLQDFLPIRIIIVCSRRMVAMLSARFSSLQSLVYVMNRILPGAVC